LSCLIHAASWDKPKCISLCIELSSFATILGGGRTPGNCQRLQRTPPPPFPSPLESRAASGQMEANHNPASSKLAYLQKKGEKSENPAPPKQMS
jgi:hypothetical protein